jgi:hypothetical protein
LGSILAYAIAGYAPPSFRASLIGLLISWSVVYVLLRYLPHAQGRKGS